MFYSFFSFSYAFLKLCFSLFNFLSLRVNVCYLCIYLVDLGIYPGNLLIYFFQLPVKFRDLRIILICIIRISLSSLLKLTYICLEIGLSLLSLCLSAA